MNYYKNVNIPEDSSSSDNEPDSRLNNITNFITNRDNTSSNTNRQKLFSIYNKNSENLNIQIPIAQIDKSAVKSDKDTVTKRSTNTACVSNSWKNDDTNRTNRNRSGSLKLRVMERLSNPSTLSTPKLPATDKKQEFIKIEDQKDVFFELSHNKQAINDIQKIEESKKSQPKDARIKIPMPKCTTKFGNAAFKAMDKIVEIKSNNKNGECFMNPGNSTSNTSGIRHEVAMNNELNNLIDLIDEEKFDELKAKDPKQFTFDTCNSKQFKNDLELYNNRNNFQGNEEMNVELPSIRLN